MKCIAAIAAFGLVVAAPGALAGSGGGRDGGVKAVSVLPAPGKVAVVIDLQGVVEVQDFTLSNPARLVIDLAGARLLARTTLYDGRNRGGIKNIRYAQFRPDVVRIVIDLDVLKDYQIKRGDKQIRIELGTDRAAFDAWSSQAVASVPLPSPPPAEPEPGVMVLAESAPAAMSGFQSVHTESFNADPITINQYLAAHAAEVAQSPAPRITVRWDGADIEDVVAGFAAFSGRTIVVGKDVKGKVTAEIKNQPWDLAFAAVLESQGLTYQVLEGGIINVLDKADFARADSTVPVETRLVRINYAKAASLVPAVQSIVSAGRGKVVADTSHNALVITDTRNRINDIEQFVRGLDIRTPQVSIQAKIIFVDRTDIEQMGVKYDLGSQTQFFNSCPAPDSVHGRAGGPQSQRRADRNGPDAVLHGGSDHRRPRRELALGDRQRQPGGDQPRVEPHLLHGDWELRPHGVPAGVAVAVPGRHPGRAHDHHARQPPGPDPGG